MDSFLLLVGFHHERGNEVEWSYPIDNPFASNKERLYEANKDLSLPLHLAEPFSPALPP